VGSELTVSGSTGGELKRSFEERTRTRDGTLSKGTEIQRLSESYRTESHIDSLGLAAN
jgi:hypothetical protein